MEETIVCTECGKVVPAELNICPECGHERRRTRASKQAAAKAPEPAGSEVEALTEAVRTVPKAPARQDGVTGVRRARRRRTPTRSSKREPPAEEPRSKRLPSRARREREARTPAASDGGPEVKRVSRRKIYRYEKSKRKKFKFGLEVKALIGVIAIGLLIILMCHMQTADAGPAPTPCAQTNVSPSGEDGRPTDPRTRPLADRREHAQQEATRHDQVD